MLGGEVGRLLDIDVIGQLPSQIFYLFISIFFFLFVFFQFCFGFDFNERPRFAKWCYAVTTLMVASWGQNKIKTQILLDIL